MIPNSLLYLIFGLFIACFFDRLFGLLGLSVVFIYYWIVYLKTLKRSRSLILPFKEKIIAQFDTELDQKGEKHFEYIYNNAQHYLHYRSSSIFASAIFMLKLGLPIIGLVALWKFDWISLTLCIIIGLIATWWASVYDRHAKMRVKSKNLKFEDEYKDYIRVLDSYNLFFKKHFPHMYHADS